MKSKNSLVKTHTYYQWRCNGVGRERSARSNSFFSCFFESGNIFHAAAADDDDWEAQHILGQSKAAKSLAVISD